MNKLIMIPIFIMIFCAILTQGLKTSTIGFQNTQQFQIQNKTGTSEGHYVWHFSGGFLTQEWVSGTSETGQSIPSVDIIGVDGLLALLIGFIAIGTALGITIFGSGLSNSSQNVIYKSVFFYALWGIFSALGCGVSGDVGLLSIPIFGTLIYIIISLCYVVGVQSQINTHESSE